MSLDELLEGLSAIRREAEFRGAAHTPDGGEIARVVRLARLVHCGAPETDAAGDVIVDPAGRRIAVAARTHGDASPFRVDPDETDLAVLIRFEPATGELDWVREVETGELAAAAGEGAVILPLERARDLGRDASEQYREACSLLREFDRAG